MARRVNAINKGRVFEKLPRGTKKVCMCILAARIDLPIHFGGKNLTLGCHGNIECLPFDVNSRAKKKTR